MKVYPKPDVVIRAQATVGEGPVWDHRSGYLCWVDIDNGMLYENNLITGDQRSVHVDTMLGAVAPRARNPGFAAAVKDGFGFIVDEVLTLVDPVLRGTDHRMNDAKCDSCGRLWAGSTQMEYRQRAGALHRWDGEEHSIEMARGFTLPNGMGWNAEDSVMYLADSMTQRLLCAPFHSEDGAIDDFSEIAAVVEGLPDGLAVDMDGCVWLAIWGGYQVQQYTGKGELIGRVPLPVEKPSSCAFSGDGTLYITSASVGMDEAQRANQPLAGSVFALHTDSLGVPIRAFVA